MRCIFVCILYIATSCYFRINRVKNWAFLMIKTVKNVIETYELFEIYNFHFCTRFIHTKLYSIHTLKKIDS